MASHSPTQSQNETQKRRMEEEDEEGTRSKKRVKVETLQSLLQVDDKDYQSVQQSVVRIAEMLLNKTVLVVNNAPHRLMEIEFYFCSDDAKRHSDQFTHKDELQRTSAQWYFHRSGQSYKAGSFKGLDITIGNDRAYGGVLVRSIQRIAGRTLEVIEGPCVVVNHILALTGESSITNLVLSPSFSLDATDTQSKLHLTLLADSVVASPLTQQYSIFRGPRVGLTLKRPATTHPNLEDYVALPYRFVHTPRRLKKAKFGLALRLLAMSMGPGSNTNLEKAVKSVVESVGTPRASLHKYWAAFNRGRSKQAASYRGKALSTEALCALFGACFQQFC